MRPNFCSLDPEQPTEGPEQDKREGKSDRSRSREPTARPVGVPRKSICNWEAGGLPKSRPGSHSSNSRTFPPPSFPLLLPRCPRPCPVPPLPSPLGEAAAPCLMGGVGVLIMGVRNSARSFLPAARVYFVHGFFGSGRLLGGMRARKRKTLVLGPFGGVTSGSNAKMDTSVLPVHAHSRCTEFPSQLRSFCLEAIWPEVAPVPLLCGSGLGCLSGRNRKPASPGSHSKGVIHPAIHKSVHP